MRQSAASAEYVSELVQLLGPGPWSAKALADAGWSRGRIDAAVRAGRLVRLRYGVLAPPDQDVDAVDVGLTLLPSLPPRAALSHSTAAAIQCTWTPGAADLDVHAIVAGASERRDGRLRIHGSRLPEHHVEVVRGARVTTVARTAVDLARGASVPDALVAMDGAFRVLLVRSVPQAARLIRQRRVPDDAMSAVREALEEAYSVVWSWPGTRAVRAALDLVDPASESPAESWARGWIIGAGLARPVVGHPVTGHSGQRYFADLAWPEAGVILEVDGVGKYGSGGADIRRSLSAERQRQHDLEVAGWVVVRCLAGESPAQWLPRLSAALRSPASYRRNVS